MISVVFIIKNALKQGYCFWESLSSCLPFADEIIISEGYSEDKTLEYIKKFKISHNNVPITIFQDNWEKISYHGEVIAKVSQRAINRAKNDWIYYLQADEVIHEDNISHIKNISKSTQYNAASFPFYHFIRAWKPSEQGYKEAIRMIRKNKRINIQGDAWTFEGEINPLCPANLSPKPIYHFGWVFPKQNDIKDIDHSKIYTNMPEYQEKMRKALQNKDLRTKYELEDFNDFPEISRRFVGKSEYIPPEMSEI